MKFPIYRKYENGRHFFKILDERRFEEIRRIGSRNVLAEVTAVRFPEIAFVTELIEGLSAVPISAEEYEAERARAV